MCGGQLDLGSQQNTSVLGTVSGSRSVVSDSATPWTGPCQAPLSMEFSGQEYWSGLSCPPPRKSSQPRDRTQVSRIAGRLFTIWATREAPKCSSFGTVMLNIKNSAFCSHFSNIHNLLQLLENKAFSRLAMWESENEHQKKPLKDTMIIVIVLLIVNIYWACAGTRHWDKSFSIMAKWNSIATPSCGYCGNPITQTRKLRHGQFSQYVADCDSNPLLRFQSSKEDMSAQHVFETHC